MTSSFASLSYVIAAVCASEVFSYGQNILNSFCAATTESYQIGILFTHMNGDFDTISMTERNCVTPISKVESQIWHRCSYFTGQLFVSAYFCLLLFAII